ncbi:MAG: hypothetical protein FWE23_08595 [Chitinivibrionia bacterium]|nr:hypothetical protein [Chitinivibrionia bacterium]
MLTVKSNPCKTKRLYIEVREDKYNFFVELVKNLDFIKIRIDKASLVNPQKENVLANIKKGFIDKKSIDKGELKTFSIEELFDD